MTVFSDGQGNHFLGDCTWANHNIGYPNLKYLKADDMTNFSADLTALLTASGLKFRNVVSQTNINNWLNNVNLLPNSLVHFGASDDIDDRYSFAVNFNGYSGTTSGRPVNLFNNSGSTNTTNQMNESTNLLAGTEYPTSAYTVAGAMSPANWDRLSVNVNFSPVYVCGVANNNSLALYFRQQRFISGIGIGLMSWFVYAGRFANVNTGFGYYNASKFTESFIMSGGNNNFVNPSEVTALNARHYISNASKYPLETGDAQYPIVCSDGQNPTSQWATDFYVFDNNATLGFPAIGKVRNLLLAQGTYTIGKPVKIQGTVVPDNGFNRWLPVGTFAGKTVLMRCYSSVEI